ncbi:gephyrin-like molybdotransferase Glp [Paraclostridium bifermentans]|uniref:molybdopterin molybdotransferase MoeA n=1 Tax=Paraclostridium bifermentans TaxID=1490 RepID=UPI0018977E22|nr:gephyrin-like molybdotransferase Glp [Paraclostridium bifermentans]
MIDISTAINKIIEESKLIGTCEKDLMESIGYTLAENIYSNDNLPPFNKSAMDGYAIKSKDSLICNENEKICLDIVGLIKAGDYFEGKVDDKQAIKIMTGAPVPDDTDAVIQIENVELDENKIILSEVVKKNRNIINIGEELKVGDLALEVGQKIRASEIGLLASLGYSKVKVYKKPILSVLTTGDELVDITDSIENGKIRNSNEYSLKALAKDLEVKSFGIIEDKKDVIKGKLKEAIEISNIIITSGGSSTGDYDFIEDVLIELGADIKFNKIAIKPGKPVIFATIGEKLVFGLPGNPLSFITTYEEFVKPAILKMSGEDIKENKFPVILKHDIKCKVGRTNYVYVDINKEDGKFYAYETGSQCSNQLLMITKSNGIVIVPKDKGFVKKGEILDGKFIFQ